MAFKRFSAALLCLSLALLTPGSQAWAQAARTGAAPSGNRFQPAARAVAVPVSRPGAAGSTSLSLDLGGTLAGPGGIVLPADIGAGLDLSAPAPALETVVPALPVPAAPADAPEHSAAPAPEPSSGEGIAAVASVASPLLKTAADQDASDSDLAETGARLQAVLEGSGLRHRGAVDELVQAAPQDGRDLSFGPTAGLKPAASADQERTETPPEPGLPEGPKSRFRFYASAVAGVKVGIEALNLAVPLLLLTQLQAATAVATLYLAAEVASIFAGLAGGALVDMIGAKRTMVLTGFAQAAAIAGVPLAIASGGALALPIVYGLFMANGVFSELFDVARRSALPQIVGQDEGVLRKYNGSTYVWREIAATSGVLAAGWLIHQVGAMATIWAHPAFCVAAGLAALRLLASGRKAHPVRAGPAAAAKRQGLKTRFQAWLEDLKKGVRYVVGEKKLRTVVLVNIPLNAVHKIFHTLVAVVFATQVLANPAMAAVMLGAWNIGELAGAFYLQRFGGRSRLSNWMRIGGAASLAVWSFYLLPFAWAGILASFILAAAMIGNELGTSSYMQSTVPAEELGAVTGFVYGLARAVGMAALLASGWAFDALGASGGFLLLAGIFTVLAPVYFLASFKFESDRLEKPTGPPAD
ncbi:MAG: MFS transporter [Elusimicrobia bacterium]|nr:MFS transporter [Elusimicrobiota bacterium]